MTRTYLALLHFDGGQFAGWQRQAASAGRTVQGEFEGVLERLAGRRIVAHAAGRTDAGVHAVGLGVSFTLTRAWDRQRLHRALNALLPRECWIESLRPVTTGFHARKSASGRRYRYEIGTDAASYSPFRRPYEWALARPLAIEPMRTAAARVLGEHDFRGFAARTPDKPHYRCTVRRAEWAERPANMGVTFRIAADRFLHHMVRFLVGTMVDVGLGRRKPEEMTTLLASTDTRETSPPAPPQGLFFEGAEYAEEWFVEPTEIEPSS